MEQDSTAQIQGNWLKFTGDPHVSSNLAQTVSWRESHHYSQERPQYTYAEIRTESASGKLMRISGTAKIRVLSIDVLGLVTALVTDLLETQ